MINKSMIVLFLIWLSLAIGSNLIGRIEGELFPVVVDFNYHTIEKNSRHDLAEGSNIFGSFKKLRNCNFERIKWYLVDGSGYRVRITINFNDEQIRMSGLHYFGPWSTNATTSHLDTLSRVYIEHNCHPIWKTVTRVK